MGCQCDPPAGYDVYLVGRPDPIRVPAESAELEAKSIDETMVVFRAGTLKVSAVVAQFDLRCLAGFVKVDR
jgi:hypothetical protein